MFICRPLCNYLGGGYYVFPCASHNRFEHSLGVCHLAGEFVKILQRNQPELGITPCDMLCVQIAGLCHDLGHGPFSHLFDGIFLPNYPDTKWKHEDASEKMLDHLIGVNNLKSSFDNCGLNDDDIMFIKELISGKYNEKRQHKKFLYEIIANKTNEIDVDKWDYFARDCHFLGIPNSFDHLRYMKFAQVIKVPEDGLQICCRDKEVLNLYEMFHTRMMLHKRAYKHKTTIAVEHMISDALILANDKFHLIGESGNSIKMSKVITDMVAYSKLSDAVIDIIIQDPSDKFRQAQQLFDRLARRQLYKYIGSIKFKLFDQTEAIKEILEFKKNFRGDAESKAILESDIFFKEVSFDYGMKGENPVDKMYFYKKSTPDVAEHINKHDVSSLLLSNFMDKLLYLYCKKYNESAVK
jgi:HD superfamily phosphohydrolase